ncbi:hypothetical protein [Nocardia sp. NPDC056000]|uniref:hypothetical protein n=1 Tax=Nocardia sp. NPDC056000 TaxID=3345674 RepID=UPI0035DFB36A
MERWGADLYGDPCGGCGFEWSTTTEQAIELVRQLPSRCRALLHDRTGSELHPDLGWTVSGYVSHIVDNLRIWAERSAGARLGGATEVSGYDPDLIGRGRRYNDVALAGALWSLEHASREWVESITAALEADVVLVHADRGRQTAADVARNNAHDGFHHIWDIERTLGAVDTE